jgi:hypothetical protein
MYVKQHPLDRLHNTRQDHALRLRFWVFYCAIVSYSMQNDRRACLFRCDGDGGHERHRLLLIQNLLGDVPYIQHNLSGTPGTANASQVAMRYENWDVILFLRDSQTPLQEFRTACFASQDGCMPFPSPS